METETKALAPVPFSGDAMVVQEGPPALLTPAARKTRPFPRWTLIALASGWFLGLLSHWIDWTLLDIAYALGIVVSLVATIVVAMWSEDRLHTALIGRHGALRMLVGAITPFFAVIVLLPVAALVGNWFDGLGGDTVAVCLILGALWFASASLGTLVIVAIDVVISALVRSFRARVQWAIMGLLGLTTGCALGVYGLARLAVSQLPRVAGSAPAKLDEFLAENKDIPISVGPDGGTKLQEFLTRSDVAELLAVAMFLGVVVLSFPAVLSASGKLAEAVMERLHPLSLGFSRMIEGDLHVRVEEKGSRDFVQISRGFNQMTAALANAMSDLDARNRDLVATNWATQRFVPFPFLELLGKESIRQVSRGDHVALDITVLFADIRGFTTYAESKGAEETFRFINRYLAVMEPEIHRRRGFINDFFGDGIMALFRDPDGAVDAAVGMLRSLNRFNEELRGEGEEEVRIGIGIHSGTLMLGTIGGQERLDCTVIGDPANFASRVEGMTKLYGANVLISEATLAALREPDRVEVREIDRVRAKGKREPMTIYEVLEGDDQTLACQKRDLREPFASALAAYRAGEFLVAAEQFEGCVEEAPRDGASVLYAQRCRGLCSQNVANWDGVTVLSSK
jgi:class 3 adenylate cyclase